MKQETLSLNNFETGIGKAILQWGQEYFDNGLVLDLEEEDDNIWSAEVCGSDDYIVEVTLDQQDDICDFSCDCPYDGYLCKHVVATLYAIREEKGANKKKTAVKPSAQEKKNAFETLLNKVNLEEYKDFIRESAAEDKNFKTKFELFFADKDDNTDVEKKYADWIRKLVGKYSDYGMIDYSSTCDFAAEIDRIIATGKGMTTKGNYRDAFLLCKGLLKGLISVIGGCDDSSGRMGEVCSDVAELLNHIVQSERVAMDLKKQILAPVYIEEQYWDMLLALLQAEANLDVLLSYHVHLSKRYPEEMLLLFMRELERTGGKVSDRNGYATLARNMQTIMKDMPMWKDEIKEIARKLITLNPRRPAMKEELGKVLK